MLGSSITDMDSRLWKTLRIALFNPGRVALEYITGARQRYINPVRFFLVVFSLYIALSIVTGVSSEVANATVSLPDHVPEGSYTWHYAHENREVLATQLNVVAFLALPLFAFFIRWQYIAAGRNYAETLCFVLFVMGAGFLYAIPVTAIQYAVSDYSFAPKYVFISVLFIVGARTFFKLSWVKTLFHAALSGFLYWSSGLIMSTLLILVRVWVRMS